MVGDVDYEATRAVVIGIGTRASTPPIKGLADTPCWSNREALEALDAPRSLIVIGGGAIGVELAQAFRRFGSDVHVLEVAPRLVVAEEPEASELLEGVFGDEGIRVTTSAAIEAVSHDGVAFSVSLDGSAPLVADRLLVAAGRRSDLEGLGVATIGLDPSARSLEVDDHLRVVGAERTWALGDVTGKGAFTHMSMYQADVVVRDVLGADVVPADYRAVPRVTFTDPRSARSVSARPAPATVGSRSARAPRPFPSSARGWIHKEGNEGVIKLVEDARRGVLVGATSVGPWGGEVLGLLALAVHAEVPTSTLRHMIYAYPTFHRAIGDAVKDLLEGTAQQ